MNQQANRVSPGFEQRLSQIQRTCSKQNWDSYGANPVTKAAIEGTKRVLDDLAVGLTITPSADGGITLECPGEVIMEIAPDGCWVYNDGSHSEQGSEHER